MINVPATISFFCIASLIVVIIATMAWKRHRKSKSQAKGRSDVESYCFDQDNNHGEDFGKDRKPKHHIRGWRWKMILYRVGWIQIPSEVENDGEMRSLSWRRAVVNGKIDQCVVSEQSVRRNPVFGVKNRSAFANKPPRLTNVHSFENLGGYRYGDYGYGPDNMSPLPVPISASPSLYYHPQGIAEVGGMSIVSSSPMFSTVPSSNKASMDSGYGYGFPLTSHNGFRSSCQADTMAALPIPRDHTLSQHHPAARKLPRPGLRIRRLSEEEEFHEIERKLEEEDEILLKEEHILEEERNLEEEERILSVRKFQEVRKGSHCQYQRASLVPAPLMPRRGRPSPASRHSASQNRSRPSRAQQSSIAELESPPLVTSRPQSQGVSAFGSTPSATSDSRYSRFENPLRQHPVELEDIVRQPQGIAKPVVAQAAESQAAATEWPLRPRRRRKRYTWAVEPTQISLPIEAPTTEKQDEEFDPRSLQVKGQVAKTPNDLVHLHSRRIASELKGIFENPDDDPTEPNSLRINTRHASAPPQPPTDKPAQPPSLQIGRRTSTVANHQHHRRFSICDGTWVSSPLRPTLERQSPGNPARGGSTADEVKGIGKKRGHED